jgi:NAD(P)-dependent dehydrogenase (short-subunit alcohol dehydrogenase family)
MAERNKEAVFITGASSGIGRETALFFDNAGYRVFAGVRKVTDGTKLCSEASSNLIPIILDITSPQGIVEAVNAVSDKLGHHEGIQCLINNAGIVVGGPLEYLKIEDFRYQIEVNLIGQLAVTQAFLPFIRKGKGRVLFVGSASGWFALPFNGAYTASKFALRGMVETLRRELDPWQIPVVLIECGTVKTAIWEKSFSDTEQRFTGLEKDVQKQYKGTRDAVIKMMLSGWKSSVMAEDVAKVIFKAVQKKYPRARYQVGKDAKMAVLSVFVPDFFKDWLIRNILKGKIPTAMMGW